jgi:hypothetical protein
MNTLIKDKLTQYKKEVEYSYVPTDSMVISNKGLEEQLLVLFLAYNLVGFTKKSLSFIKEGLTIPKTQENAIHFLNLNSDGDIVLVNVNQHRKSESGVQQIKNQITGVLRNVFQLERSNKTFADKEFVNHYNNLMESLEEPEFTDVTKLIYVVTDYELTDRELKEVDNYANVSASDYDNVSVFVIDLNRLFKGKIKDTVISNRKANLSLFSPNNAVHYKNQSEQGVVVNLSALSLKSTYQKFGIDLFDYNLRYYINIKAQDSEVVKTIKNNPEDFWLFNNGLVITCENFNIKDKSIDIENITIVNGGQTTSIIGNTDFDKDFPVIAKIIAIGNSSKEKRERMTEIAVYANSQKPIKQRDLKANTIEQRELQKLMAEYGVFVGIKRGEKTNISTEQAWQETTNEELGQALLACFLQMPGAARSQKSSIFKKNYSFIFERKQPYSPEYLMDLLKLRSYVFDLDYKERGYFGLKAGVFANSKFFILAALAHLLSKENGTDLDYVLYQGDAAEPHDKDIRLVDVEDHDKLNRYTDQIVDLIHNGYMNLKKKEFASESYPISNFTKLDSNYEAYVLNELVNIK